MFAELASEDDAVRAIERLHDAGYRRLEAYMPYPSQAIEEALGHRSRLPYVIFVIGIGAALGAYGLQWLLVAHLYPLVVGGRPPHFPLAFVVIAFEMGVLFASLTAFGGTLAAGKLVRLTDDVQGIPGFTTVTRDHFWLEVSTRDPAYDEDAARRVFGDCGAIHVAIVEDER
jgi:hypothetical protein